MEMIILMCWSIWTQRNGWLFQNSDPSIQNCISSLRSELVMVIHRTKKSLPSSIMDINISLAFLFYPFFVPLYSYFITFSNKILVGGHPLLFHKKEESTIYKV
jgi:predicted PurR-regulated permease PerM